MMFLLLKKRRGFRGIRPLDPHQVACFGYVHLAQAFHNPSFPKGGVATTPKTVFAPVLKKVQPRVEIAQGTFKFILSHFSGKIE